MRFVIQRVTEASVTIDGEISGKIGKGYLVLIGVADTDTKETDSSEEETPEEEQPAEEEPAEPETVTMKVNASSVNVRSEASTDSSIVTKVANGETVEVVGDASQEWVQIRCTEQDGKEGYVKSEFLTAAE